MRGVEGKRRVVHPVPARGVREQRANFLQQRICIGDAQCGTRRNRIFRRFPEIERVRPDDRRRAHGNRLDQVVPAERQQIAADECDIGRGVISGQLAERIAQYHRNVCWNRPVFTAPDERNAPRPQQIGDSLKALRMARHDDRQCATWKLAARERFEQQYFLAIARAGGDPYRSRISEPHPQFATQCCGFGR